MANGTLTEEEERLLMERAAARAANPAVTIATDLSASYVPAKYPNPLDVFKEMVPEYTQYTPQGDTWLGGTGPQIDELGNVRVWRGETIDNMDAVSGVKFFGLDPAPSNWATHTDPSIHSYDPRMGQVNQGFTKYGTITPEEAIYGYDYVSGSTTPDFHEVTFTPDEAAKVVPGGSAVAKTIHNVPSYQEDHPAGGAKTKAIKALTTPLPGTGVETSMLGKAGPYLKGAGRVLGLAGYPMSAMAASDYWGAGKPVRAAMAAGSALPVVGLPLLAAEMVTNAVTDGIQPQDAADASMGGGGMPGPGMGGHPGMGMAAGYDVSGQTPSLAGTQTGMPVAMDAGGAIGGVPGVQPTGKYGPSGYEGESIPPSGYRQIAPDTVIAASDFEVGPTSMAMVGTNAFGIPDRTYGPTTETVPVADPNSYPNMATAYPVTDPVSIMAAAQMLGSDPALQADDTQTQVDTFANMPSWDTSAVSQASQVSDYGSNLGDYLSTLDKVSRLGNTGLLDTPSDFTSPISWDHPYMSSEDATYSQALKSQMADDMFGTIGRVGYGVAQPVQEAIRNALGMQFAPSDDPSDYRSQAVSGYPTGVPGTIAQVATGWADVQPGVRELVDDLIEENVLGITTPDVTPTTFDSTPTVTTPAVTTPTGPTPAEIAAAAAQRKSDLAAQKAAAAATRELTRLRNLQTAQDKARQKRDADRRASAKAAAKALLAKAKSSDKGGYSDREINAAIEIAHEIDTFGSGGQVDRMGPTGGRGGEGPGGRSHGGGHHGR